MRCIHDTVRSTPENRSIGRYQADIAFSNAYAVHEATRLDGDIHRRDSRLVVAPPSVLEVGDSHDWILAFGKTDMTAEGWDG
jgi:hypothetical protein